MQMLKIAWAYEIHTDTCLLAKKCINVELRGGIILFTT